MDMTAHGGESSLPPDWSGVGKRPPFQSDARRDAPSGDGLSPGWCEHWVLQNEAFPKWGVRLKIIHVHRMFPYKPFTNEAILIYGNCDLF